MGKPCRVTGDDSLPSRRTVKGGCQEATTDPASRRGVVPVPRAALRRHSRDRMRQHMTMVERFRGVSRRMAVAVLVAAALPGLIGVTGNSATAGAYSPPGLPVEDLQVPSAAMGR